MPHGKSGGSESVFQVQGPFDVRAARQVGEFIEASSGRARIRIDFTRVTAFEDFGIAVLAQALKHARRIHVKLVGLRTHQLRMLKYFGVDAAALAEERGRDGRASV